MSEYRTLARHSSHYFIAQIAALIAGFVSLPILTRVLTKEDFGQLSLVLLAVNFIANFARLGIPQSIPRHFAEYQTRGIEQSRSYTSSILLCAGGAAFSLLALAVLLERLLPDVVLGISRHYVVVIGALLAGEVLLSVLSELYRAELKSVATAALVIVSRYATLAGSLLFFFYVSETLASFLAGKALVQAVVVGLFLAPFVVSGQLRLQRINTTVIKEAVRFGMPLAMAASGGFFIAYGDRYVIQTFLGSAEVAIYSLPYDLLQNIETALTTPIRMAIVPLVFSMLAAGDGMERAGAFLSQVVRGVYFVVVPIILGLSFLGRDVIVLLASDKYADSSRLLPILATGILFGGVSFLFTVGLAYAKRTALIANLTLASGILNIGFNAALIPLLGVAGSAWATLLTYALHLVVSYHLSSRYLRLRLYWGSLLCAGAAGLCMLGGLVAATPWVPAGALGLFVQIPIGIVVYTVSLMLVEKDVRRYLWEFWQQRRLVPKEAA